MKELLGHSSAETAYMVNDYPYGSMRCRIRYWLEKNGKKGFRFVSQTENPKTLRWNAPKASTYNQFAGTMYLDEKGHVKWDGLSMYSGAVKALEFVTAFPGGDYSELLPFATLKRQWDAKYASGETYITINGQRCAVSDEDKAKHVASAAVWEAVVTKIRAAK